MESHKSKVKRIVNTIYDITTNKFVKFVFSTNSNEIIYKCKGVDKHHEFVNLFDVSTNSPMFDIDYTLDELRDRLLKEFINGTITNICF